MNSGRLRFLFVTADEFPPFRPDAEILFGKEFRQRGHHIDWVMRASTADTQTGKVDWDGWTAWVSPTNPGERRIDRIRKHLRSLRNDLRVPSLLKAGAYDFVQVKDKYLAAVVALIAARRRGLKFFFWLSFPHAESSLARARSPGSRYPVFYLLRGYFFRFLQYRIIFRFADHIFVQSEEMKRVMAANGVAPEKMTPVPMGVDLEAFVATDSLPRLETDRDAQIVLYLGSLDRPRRVDFLVEVFAEVASDYPSAKLYFVGDSEEAGARAFLESEAARLGLSDRVVFTGFLPRDEALTYVRSAAVCVALMRADPVYGVGSPTKLLEYMALERPVLANSHPDQALVIGASNGGLCVAWEVEPFAAALARLLDHPEQAREMGVRGREYVKHNRTYKMIADNLEQQYRRLLA